MSDFNANDAYHVKMERLSRATPIPVAKGKSTDYWFYERARGQYLVELNRQPTTASKKEFKSRCPKNRCISKTKVGAMIAYKTVYNFVKATAYSDVKVNLNGEDSVVQIVSRSVGKDTSIQVFHPIAVGNTRSRAHIQCDSILMDQAKISSIPEIAANHVDAQIVHEAAIGKINSDQLMKLQTFGLDVEEAEKVIVEGFLK